MTDGEGANCVLASMWHDELIVVMRHTGNVEELPHSSRPSFSLRRVGFVKSEFRCLIMILLVCCFGFCVNTQAGEAGHPNILFIAVDDLRPSLGCYGDQYAKTPNIDRLAAQGVQFDNAHCQVAVCNPSRASLMTGLRPDKLGVWTLPIHFREAKPDAVTLPQWLRRSGYTAVSHGKIFHNPTPDPQSWSEPIRPAPRIATPSPAGTPQRIRTAQHECGSD